MDCYAVNSMSDEQLLTYVPRFGDRIAIRQYCRREVAALEGNTTVSIATENLMAKLQGKRDRKRKHCDNRSEKLSGNTNAQKNERSYQMGLFEEVRGSFVQIKEKRGGGTRHLKALKSATMAELLECGKELFFPNGKNKLGDINEFELKLRDFTEEEVDPQTTLSEQYEMRKVKILRLYLSCKRTDTTASTSIQIVDEYVPEGPSTSAISCECHEEPVAITEDNGSMIDSSFLSEDGVVILEPGIVNVMHSSISIDEEIQFGYTVLQDSTILDDTLPIDPFEIVQDKPQATKLRLRRGNIFQDLNAAFTDGLISVNDCLVEIEMVLPNGSSEKGEDNGGILRDALSEYWGTFFMKCTAGSTLKVPMTRHDMKDEWENVAKVMVLGYNIVQYFPIVLAKPFLCYCLGLEIDEDELFTVFLEIVPQEEKHLVEEAMRDFTSVSEREEWIEFLEAHEVKLVITEKNAKQILLDVAHKEIVQDPAYIAECWSPVLKKLKLPSGGLNELMIS